MALITKPLTDTTKTVEEARHLALAIVAAGVIIAVLYFGRVFFVTSMVSVIIAFILEPFVALLMRVRFPRSLAAFVVCSVALLFLYIIGMGAYSQLSGLYEDLPTYGQRVADLVDDVRLRVQSAEVDVYGVFVSTRQKREEARIRAEQAAAAAKARKNPKNPPAPAQATAPVPELQSAPIAGFISAHVRTVYHVLLMASFIPFLVYFMLSWRDHINRSFLQFFHGESRLVAARSLDRIAEIVRAFVVGNSVLGLLLAAVSSVIFWWIHLPYPMLVGALSGFMSLVPYVGLPLAMLAPLFAALAVNTFSTYVLVVVVVSFLHLLALNLLYPKIVGARVHLNPLVVTFSLMLWGFLWDAPGLVLAIPMTACLKAVCDNIKGLRPVGKFLGD